ncbi:hypothetical protein MKW92_034857 [Papaver armeniacum]|nr:hypothetical protein MKW92_034857 [Papaver armeniacum]
MRTQTQLKAKGNTRASPQQVTFELKSRVIHTLNKLADRDTYQLGVEELEKTAESLTPEGVAPFISCVIDTDSGQKSAVRKECVRIMGTLARFHDGLLGPHVAKMMSSIVKRLRDPDSVVRDACVEAVGVLASKLSNYEEENDGSFVLLVKPLFEALGEQNKVVQCGSALCLASVIDNAIDPPISILARMLTRITKFLKNPHFMAKPAVVDLVRSIIQAGGASSQNTLSAAMSSIQEALKSSDWATRKAASVALAGIVVSGGSSLMSFKASCICALESCRFDKVKPVRDSVSQALHCWKSLPGSDAADLSETGSSTKENLRGEYSDLTSASDGGWKDVASKNIGKGTVSRRVPLTSRRMGANNVPSPQKSKAEDWEIQIAVPKTCPINLMDRQEEESEGSCLTKAFERRTEDTRVLQDNTYDYSPTDGISECSMSNLVDGKFEIKRVSHDFLEKSTVVKSVERNKQPTAEEAVFQHPVCPERSLNRQSLDSTITEVSSQVVRGCCSRTANEMAIMQKQLSEIENKQSSLMDMLQLFMGSTMESLSMLHLKVLGLESSVDRIAQDFVHKSHSNMAGSKVLRNSHSVSSSPRVSTCTLRTSMDIQPRRSSRLAAKSRDVWGGHFNHRLNVTGKCVKPNIITEPKIQVFVHLKVEEAITASPRNFSGGENSIGYNNNLWKRVKDYICKGDLDSAFVEVLRSGDDLTLIELLDRTGPVLEMLSQDTACEVLSTLASHFLDQRFLGSIIPWLQQMVDLSNTYGPDYLDLPAKARREFLSAVQEAATMDFPNPADRRSVTQLALKLRHAWGKFSQ